ncbi:MAG TPA: DUF3999 family protein [Vicinamibacterales bacterium]|nr:DUF3999 family protein [Vicinamibacterales bacterium]
MNRVRVRPCSSVAFAGLCSSVAFAGPWSFVALLSLSVLGLCPSVAAQEARFAVERPVHAPGAGPLRLPVDVDLLTAGQPFRVVRRGDAAIAEGGLGDLRFFDAEERPVPYLLVHTPSQQRVWVPAIVLPVAAGEKSSGFEVDLQAPAVVDGLRVEGVPPPFLKRVVLEGSGDRARWTMLVSQGTLFDLPDEQLRQTTLSFEPGPYRFLRLTWDDTNSGRVPLPRSVAARRAAPMRGPPAQIIDLVFERRPSEPGRSRYRVRLPGAGVPVVAIEIDAGGGHVYRRATVSESRFSGTEAAPASLGQATLVRVVRESVTAAALRVPIATPREPELDLVIEDGANIPLDLRKVSAVLAQLPWIYVEAPPGVLLARYGNRTLEAPTYDLEAVRRTLDLSAVAEAAWGEPRRLVESAAARPEADVPGSGPEIDANAFRHVRSIDVGQPGLVALSLDSAALAHSRGPSARFADVRVLDAQGRQIPYLIERRDEPLSVDLTITPASNPGSAELTRPEGGRRSVYAIAIPQPQLPSGTLVVETSARVFRRTVRVGLERAPDRRHRTTWFDVQATGTWQHVDQETPPEPLSLALPPLDRTELLLVVDEGDNPALPIASARLLLPQYRLRFFHPNDSTLRLVYGQADAEPPRYDLALLAPQVMGAPAAEIGAAPEPDAGGASATPALLSPVAFWLLLGISVLVLLGLIARLVRAGP